MGRSPCCDPSRVKKGVWSKEEDKKLTDYVTAYGCSNWLQLPKYAGNTTQWHRPLCVFNTKLLQAPVGWRCPLEPYRLLRCGKSCRLRWLNYLSPSIKRGNFTEEEEETIIRLHESLGNRWSTIAAKIPGRTDNEIKNYWNTNIKKRVKQKLVTDKSMPTSIREEVKVDRNSNSLRIAATQTTDGSLLQPTDFSNKQSKYVTGQEKDFVPVLHPISTAKPPSRESFMLPSLSSSDDLSSMTFDSEPAAAAGKELDIYNDVFAFLDAYKAPPTSESFEVFMDDSKSTELTTLETDLSSMNSNSSSGDLLSPGENLTCDDVFAFLEGYKAPVKSSLSESSRTSNAYNTYSDDGYLTPLIDVAMVDFSSTNS